MVFSRKLPLEIHHSVFQEDNILLHQIIYKVTTFGIQSQITQKDTSFSVPRRRHSYH